MSSTHSSKPSVEPQLCLAWLEGVSSYQKREDDLEVKAADFERRLTELTQQIEALAKKANVDAQTIEHRKADVQAIIVQMQSQLGKNSGESSPTVPAENTENSAVLEQAAEAVRSKPETEYTFDDWNTRAFDAHRKNDFEGAARYWKSAAAAQDAAHIQTAQSLYNTGVVLGLLKRSEEAIVVYDEVVRRFGEATEPALREQVAWAQNGKGFNLICRAKANWQDEVTRNGDLQAALALFKQAEVDFPSADKPIVWGNQAYSHFLLGQIEPVRALLQQTLQQGGEKLYQGTLGDLAIHPVPPDADFRILLDAVWAEVQSEK